MSDCPVVFVDFLVRFLTVPFSFRYFAFLTFIFVFFFLLLFNFFFRLSNVSPIFHAFGGKCALHQFINFVHSFCFQILSTAFLFKFCPNSFRRLWKDSLNPILFSLTSSRIPTPAWRVTLPTEQAPLAKIGRALRKMPEHPENVINPNVSHFVV